MAELELNIDERPGIKKEIDEGAMDLIFQAIQEDIYSFPIRSFVREGISNGLDAVIERNVFEAINSGRPVHEYYAQRNDGKLLKDSHFDADYYNPAFLSEETKVLVHYEEGSPRDKITISDKGVGLAGSRLKGYFKLGYSSKRNMKHVIGKFGAGAKAGLATGVEFFVMETTYNGYKTSFMIFKHDYDPITPQHPDGKTEEWRVTLADGTEVVRRVHWEPTTDLNGVSVSLEVKKHNKDLFIESVKSQFQYFNGRVHLTHTKLDGSTVIDALNEKPMYESDALLIPKYSTYTSPHILVDGISYGVVSWEELELERRQGRVAIKVAATDVDITQSRESLKWTEKTKKTVLKAIEIAREEASDYMTKKLELQDDQDIFHLCRLYSNMHTRKADSVDSVFKKFLDIGYIQAKFTLREPFKDVTTRMNFPLFEFLFYGYSVRRLHTYKDGGKIKIRTESVESFSALGDAKVIYAEGASLGPKLAVHILNKYDVGHFVHIRKSSTRIKSTIELHKKEYSREMVDKYTQNLLEKYCTLNLDKYDVVYDELEEDLEGEIKEEKVSVERGLAARERKANREVLYMRYVNQEFNVDYRGHAYRREKVTLKISDIKEASLEHKEGFIIVPGKFTALGRLVELAGYLTTGTFPQNVIYVSQEVVPHFAPYGKVVTDYFRELNPETGELMIGKNIRALNTLRIFRELLEENKTFANKDNVIKVLTDVNIHMYNDLQNSSKRTDPKEALVEYGNVSSSMLEEIFGYLKVLEEFQNVVKTGDKGLIATEALNLFGSDKIYHLDAYDEEFISSVKEGLERLAPIEPVLATVNTDSDLTRAKELFELLIKTKHDIREKGLEQE